MPDSLNHYLRTRVQYDNAPLGTIVLDYPDEMWTKVSPFGWTIPDAGPVDPDYQGIEIDGTKRLILFWGCNDCAGTLLVNGDLCLCTPILSDADFAEIYAEIEGAR